MNGTINVDKSKEFENIKCLAVFSAIKKVFLDKNFIKLKKYEKTSINRINNKRQEKLLVFYYLILLLKIFLCCLSKKSENILFNSIIEFITLKIKKQRKYKNF